MSQLESERKEDRVEQRRLRAKKEFDDRIKEIEPLWEVDPEEWSKGFVQAWERVYDQGCYFGLHVTEGLSSPDPQEREDMLALMKALEIDPKPYLAEVRGD